MPIEPDAKDWTWVLERRCPECGYDARSVLAPQVAAAVRDNAVAWEAVLRRDDVRARPSSTRWSSLEYGCHVRDVCELYLLRLRLMQTEVDPLFANWDQDAAAIERRYVEQEPAVVTAALLAAAAALADGLDGLGEEDWARTGRRSDGATFTIDSFVRYLLHDLVHHRWDVGAR
jgi:DinB superfamily